MTGGRGPGRRPQARLESTLAQALGASPARTPSWLLEMADEPEAPSRASSDVTAWAAAQSGTILVEADGSRATTWRDALEVLAGALDFPAYYGHNADAFIDCLADVLDPPRPGPKSATDERYVAGGGREIVVLIRAAGRLLRRAYDRDRFVEVVGAALDRTRALRSEAAFAVVVDRRPQRVTPTR